MFEEQDGRFAYDDEGVNTYASVKVLKGWGRMVVEGG